MEVIIAVVVVICIFSVIWAVISWVTDDGFIGFVGTCILLFFIALTLPAPENKVAIWDDDTIIHDFETNVEDKNLSESEVSKLDNNTGIPDLSATDPKVFIEAIENELLVGFNSCGVWKIESVGTYESLCGINDPIYKTGVINYPTQKEILELGSGNIAPPGYFTTNVRGE